MLTQTTPVLAGTPPVFSAPTLSDTADVGMLLIVKNGGASTLTVTMVTPGDLPTGDSYPDKAYTIAAGAERWIPVLADYRAASGLAAVTFSSVTSVTAAVINRI